MASSDLILDRYKPLGKAGEGGFGTVQVAWDPRIQRKVAIKTIKLTELDAVRAGLPGADAIDGYYPEGEMPWDGYPEDDESRWDDYPEGGALPWDDYPGDVDLLYGDEDDSQDASMVRALAHLPGLDEARTAAMLSDSHIVTVYDFEVRDRTAYLIMEYVEGLTLTKLLRAYDGSLTLDMVACVFDAVSGALRTAHDNGVLHLDIKPDNILLGPQGQVKVTDFGLATLTDAAGEGTTGGGTIGYMPPEQMRREYLDTRCDEWALASVTYEMMVGTNPFVVPKLDEAEAAIEDAELVLPSLCWEGLDEAVDDVVFTALDPDRDERYDTVAEFADDLQPYLGDPVLGRAQIATLVCNALGIVEEDEEGEEEDEPEIPQPAPVRAARKPMNARLDSRSLGILARLFAALGSGVVTFIAVSNMTRLLTMAPDGGAIVLVLTAAAAVLGALIPHVGALVAFLLLGIALIMGSSPIAGILLIVADAVWWWFAGRGGKAAANVALSLPLFGALGANVFAPLVAGASLPPARALGTMAFAAVCAFILGAMGSGNLIGWGAFANWHFAQTEVDAAMISLLAQPASWCMVASWIAAAGVGALCSRTNTTIGSVAGVLLSFALLAVGSLGAVWFDSGRTAFDPSLQLVLPLVLSTIAVLVGVLWLKPASTKKAPKDAIDEDE